MFSYYQFDLMFCFCLQYNGVQMKSSRASPLKRQQYGYQQIVKKTYSGEMIRKMIIQYKLFCFILVV
jgi:hypothetical protein